MILPLRQLNYLKEFWFDPCDAPLVVYARAFIPAFLILLLTWYTPDLSNILFNATKPTKAIAKRRSGRKGKGGSKAFRPGSRWSRLNPAAFDIDEFIGKQIGATTNFQNRSIGGLEWRLWLVFGVLERIGYKIFVINAVTDFFFNWMSIAEQSEFCMAQRSYIVLREQQGGILLSLGGWNGVYCFTVLKQRGIASGVSSVAIPANQWITVSAGASFRPSIPGQIPQVKVRLRDSTGNIVEGEVTSDAEGNSTGNVEGRFRGPRIVYFEAETTHNARYDATLSAHGIPAPGTT